ncbi:uncharacterized protein LOC132751543 [Ruditapes philippinarum]|uniref:uncharacterized protein LOC132751543 n=1 Tax=Ruditapes philippinarum TaxID=129788 RepID=UPI00295B060D|nr:uncharacterized protein LOC132751543 [Ruditapes philippinarum]
MELINAQTLGFIIAFLVALVALVMALSKRFPIEKIIPSTPKRKVPVRYDDHDQPSIRNRRLTLTEQRSPDRENLLRMASMQPLVSSSPPISPTSTTRARPSSPTPRASTHPDRPSSSTPAELSTTTTSRASTPPARPSTATLMAHTPPARPSTPTPRALTPTASPSSSTTKASSLPGRPSTSTPSPARPSSPTPRATSPTTRQPSHTLIAPTFTVEAHTPTPRAPSPPARPSSPTSRVPTHAASPSTATTRPSTPPGIPSTFMQRAHTPPARPSSPTQRAPTPPTSSPTSTVKAPTPPTREPSHTLIAHTSTVGAPTPTPRAPTPQASPSTSTSRAPTPPGRPLTSPPRAHTTPARPSSSKLKAPSPPAGQSPTLIAPTSPVGAPLSAPRAPTPPASLFSPKPTVALPPTTAPSPRHVTTTPRGPTATACPSLPMPTNAILSATPLGRPSSSPPRAQTISAEQSSPTLNSPSLPATQSSQTLIAPISPVGAPISTPRAPTSPGSLYSPTQIVVIPPATAPTPAAVTLTPRASTPPASLYSSTPTVALPPATTLTQAHVTPTPREPLSPASPSLPTPTVLYKRQPPATAPTPSPVTLTPRASTPTQIVAIPPATAPTLAPVTPMPMAHTPPTSPTLPTLIAPTSPVGSPISNPRAPTPPASLYSSTPTVSLPPATAPSPPPVTLTPRALTPPASPYSPTPTVALPPATAPSPPPVTLTPRASTPPGSLYSPTPTVAIPPATAPTPPPVTPTSRAPTPPASHSLPTPTVLYQRQPPATAPTPAPVTPTPRAPTPPASQSLPTPTVLYKRKPPATANTLPPVTPIHQQADMAEQLTRDQDPVIAHGTHLKNNKYRQWVKAGLGLGYLKEGLVQFCADIGEQQHKDIINQIQATKTPKPNVPCGVCQITTLQPDHLQISKGKCPFNQDKCNCCYPKQKNPCPNNVCGAIYDNILQNHASHPPAPFWKNSDARHWSVDPWSICKCFINAPGYNDKTSADNTDCAGLLHVIINNKYFHNHIGCNVTVHNNLFSKVRQYRNKIFHSSSMELEERVANSYIDDMIAVLQDGKELVHHHAAQQALGKLQDLKKEDFIITTESFEEILTQIKEEMTKVLKSTEDAATKKDYDELEKKFTDLETQVNKGKEEIKRFNVEDSLQQKLIEYETAKSGLKEGLVQFYKTRHSQIFLSPLFDEKDTPLSSFYIRPELSSNVSTQTGNVEKILSLSEIFKTGNQEICVLADAGLGKTAFSKYLATVWCQAHKPDENMKEELSKDDIDCMQEFDFLFLVLLRDSDDLCSIDDLIFENIVECLGLEEKLSEDVLLKILKNEKCLVILDGLDEWTHPDKKCYKKPRSIPHRKDREKCTILTTTRPWKIGVLNLNSSQLGKKVELTKLSYISAMTLSKRIIQRLKFHPNNDALQNDVKKFIEAIRKRENAELAYVPLLLIYTTCLWCEGVQIENFKCDLYINIVELLLSRTTKIHGELKLLRKLSSSDIPECFAKYDNCTKYYPLLMYLGKLAYCTLFNETKENTLVFDGSIAEKYLTKNEMTFALQSGMLSESTSKSAREMLSKVSFSHKTVQEFFAAIFISSHSDEQKNVVEKCRHVQDILDMSKIYEFMSRLNADSICAISNDLMFVINEDETTRNYRTDTDDTQKGFGSPLYHIQEMFMSCLQEMPEIKHIHLCLQDFFIDHLTVHSKQLQHLLKQNKTNIKSLDINTMFPSTRLSESIDLFSLKDLGNIQKLCYRSNGQKVAWINLLLFPSLQNVTLLTGKWTNDEIENFVRLQDLQYLNISLFKLTHKMLETILNFIAGQKSMKEITLSGVTCKEHHSGCMRLNMDFSQHSTLRKLCFGAMCGIQLNITTPSLVDVELGGMILDESSWLLSRDMLNIERVELLSIALPPGRLQNDINLLENLPKSVTVNLVQVYPEIEYAFVIEHIRRSKAFHVIQEDWRGFKFKTKK